MRLLFIIIFLIFVIDDLGFTQKAKNSDKDDEKVSIQYQDIPIDFVLIDYEKITGKRIVRDEAIAGASISMIVGKELDKDEAARFIEKSLLLNGFALVPSAKEEMKIIAFSQGKHPQSEGLDVYYEGMILPDGDQVINYVMIFDYLKAEEAALTMQQVIRNHAYGAFTPTPNAPILIITENSRVIKTLIDLKELIDVPPEKTEKKIFQLEMSDAEEVAKTLQELLELDNNNSISAPPVTLANRGQSRTQTRTQNLALTGNTQTRGFAPKAKIHPITRTNRILAIARPIDLVNIEAIIEELDAPGDRKNFLRRTLRYMPVLDFLPVAKDSLLRGAESGGQSGQQNTPSRSANSGSSGGGATSSGTTVSLGNPEEFTAPQSLVVGKTLLIADPDDNKLIVSGPPESIRVIQELLDEMDKRPKQIYISTVIGQLTLGDDINTGLDLLRTLEVFERDGNIYRGAGLYRTRTSDGASILDLDNLRTIGDSFPIASGLTLYGQIGEHLNAYLSVLESTNRFKVLSRPTVFTLNNKKAVISTGERIAVPTSTLTSVQDGGAITSNIEFEEVVLRLEVIPLINSENEVTLQIAQTNDNITGNQVVGGNEIPTIGTQKMITTVMAPNKSTVLLGGLITESESEVRSGVPILVKTPILKHLFSSKSKSKTRRELLIFIQPQIVDKNSDIAVAGSDVTLRTELVEDVAPFAIPPIEDYNIKYPPIKVSKLQEEKKIKHQTKKRAKKKRTRSKRRGIIYKFLKNKNDEKDK